MLKLLALGTLGYVGYRYFSHAQGHQGHAAFAPGQTSEGNRHQVRDAGPEAMRDTPQREWSATDEASDESFPASDPPATY